MKLGICDRNEASQNNPHGQDEFCVNWREVAFVSPEPPKGLCDYFGHNSGNPHFKDHWCENWRKPQPVSAGAEPPMARPIRPVGLWIIDHPRLEEWTKCGQASQEADGLWLHYSVVCTLLNAAQSLPAQTVNQKSVAQTDLILKVTNEIVRTRRDGRSVAEEHGEVMRILDKYFREAAQTVNQEMLAALRAKLKAIVGWLEENQPDVFKRGLWDAIARAESEPAGQGGWTIPEGKSYRDGEPCSPTCLAHVSHPCEKCGRIGGRWPSPPASEAAQEEKR